MRLHLNTHCSVRFSQTSTSVLNVMLPYVIRIVPSPETSNGSLLACSTVTVADRSRPVSPLSHTHLCIKQRRVPVWIKVMVGPVWIKIMVGLSFILPCTRATHGSSSDIDFMYPFLPEPASRFQLVFPTFFGHGIDDSHASGTL